MTRYELSLIDNEAYKLHQELKQNPPIQNFYKLIENLGGTLEEVDLIEDAHIEKDDNKFIIRVNKNNSELRNNFSIAHEIGHLILHMGYNPKEKKFDKDFEDNKIYYRYGNSREEYEANEFAGAFLMPESKFIEIVNENTNDKQLCSINKVSKYFNVSNQSVISRGKFLGIFS
ncbi:ImmA/IrrE family metallo-endopeptidase [Brachyspira hyodysenteriae]|uniref:ImmA/IrrE family metallo-endopeptidase n=1 Tax=Brachyspira hyodysenteriae TaxID=159 RepID=UPI002B262F0A|nr:ImmA/IrrE family metallo-endopeptidase [Brachyspira hyodysenteriae]WPC24716.1 ImmA/IrrE family metallo-endopeptidase [Brachyspira hyodysenteriae]